MKGFNWREGISARLTYRLRGYLREVERIKKAAAKDIPGFNSEARPLWEFTKITAAKQRWF